MAERAEPPRNERDVQPPDESAALTELVLVQRRSRWANGELWTALGAGGRRLSVWRLDQVDEAVRELWADAATELVRVRHRNLVPVLAAGGRDGGIIVVSALDAGCPLRRLLAVATLTTEQAALITAAVIEGLRALHRAGLCHGGLDDRTVHLGAAGQVRLGEWGLTAGAPDPDASRRDDGEAAVRLLGRLGRSVRRPGHREGDPASALLHALDACVGDGGEPAALLEQAREAAAAVLPGRAGERATSELAALVGLLEREPPPRPVASSSHATAPAPRHPLRSPEAVWAPAPHRARWVAAGVAVLLLVAVAGALAAGARNGRSLSVAIVPHPGREASPVPVTGVRAPARTPVPSPAPTGPRPVPTLAPAAAGPITAIEIQPLAGACQPNATCAVQVTVRLQPQPAAEEVRWSFHVFDRCTGTTDVVPGASVTALAGWAYVYGTSWPDLPPAHPLALVAVTESPAAAASPAVLAGGSNPC